MRKILLFAVLDLILFAVAAQCQTISPLFTSYQQKPGKPFSGQFTITNNAITPTNVQIKTAAFHFDKDGKQVLDPIDGRVELTLSQKSFRLGPRQSMTVVYKATCNVVPCSFAMFAGFVAGHAENGMSVIAWLPTSAYVCESDVKHCREKVRAELGEKQ